MTQLKYILQLLLLYSLYMNTTDIVKILVVDDDQGLRDLLQRYLTQQNFDVYSVADALEMNDFFAQQSVDLMILDLMLPGEDGLSIARRLRAESDLPIIILSAKGEEVEKIIGLEIGADDYLAKPFNPRELLARIRAILRRQGTTTLSNTEKKLNMTSEIAQSHQPNHSRQPDNPHETYHFGPYQLDATNYRLYCHQQEIALTSGEFNLLKVFVTHSDRVLSRDQLMDLIKGYERSPFDRSIDIRITRLRKKIEQDPKKPQYIRTIWGAGYLFSNNNLPTEHTSIKE